MSFLKKNFFGFILILSFITTTSVFSNEAKKEEAKEEKHVAAMIEEEPGEFEPLHVRQSLRTTLIPKVLSEQMEEKFREENPEKTTIPRSFLKIHMYLTNKTGEVLEKNYKVISPMGGGTTDLSEMILEGIGSFILKIKISKENGESVDNLKVYAISQARGRQIGDEKWGDGCGKVYDITSRFIKDMGHGWTLYTKDQRYLTLLGGTLLFVSQDRKGIALAAMTFLDSRYKHLTCFPQSKSE